jgi:DNA-binding PadR family transcriptional regulator
VKALTAAEVQVLGALRDHGPLNYTEISRSLGNGGMWLEPRLIGPIVGVLFRAGLAELTYAPQLGKYRITAAGRAELADPA